MKLSVHHGFILILMLLTTGCTRWPAHGFGGMAELRPTTLPAPYDYPYNHQNIEKIINYNTAIQNKINAHRVMLQQCMPGRLVELDMQSVLILRELHARLWYDTLYNIDKQDMNIRKTVRELNQLQQKTDCGRSAKYNLNQWSLL